MAEPRLLCTSAIASADFHHHLQFPCLLGKRPVYRHRPRRYRDRLRWSVYGTTATGGTYGGTVFSLTPPAAPGGLWTETTLYNLGGDYEDSFEPAGLTIGSGGVLYGTTFYGGLGAACYYELDSPPDCGAVFSVTPPSAPAGAWTEALVFQASGLTPSSLAVGGSGILYGLMSAVASCQTSFPGTLPTCSDSATSALYSLAPPTTPFAAWTATALYYFPATVGPYSNVVIGSGGLPYVATRAASGLPAGQVLSFSPPEQAAVIHGQRPCFAALPLPGPIGSPWDLGEFSSEPLSAERRVPALKPTAAFGR